ncbi:hypothetical protein DH2020_035164 [Rehmannia glutinosa]|uniref:Transcription factor CBF/NF-Y/archaeal histone domain-containing protein n=1 Tax=Rehmannia glutinosa TaxID=99300 RepID=A0ABR0V948_REHGL
MESGGSSNLRHEYPTRTPTTGSIVIREGGDAAAATANNPTNVANLNPQQPFKRDVDQYMPIANVIRIMRRVLPAHAKIADDAKETIQECVSEFISFITSEANETCRGESRKTISPEDVLSAMQTLGFDNYIEPLTIFLDKYRAQDPERGSMNHVSFVRHGVVHRPRAQMARPPVPAPPPPMTLSTTRIVDRDNYIGLPQIMRDYFMSNQNQGGGEGSSSGGV